MERTPISRLSNCVCTCSSAAIPDKAVYLARRRMIDVLGCAFGGAYAPGNEAFLELLKRHDARKEASVWVHGGRLSLEEAAMVNSIFCRSYDYEVMTPAHLYATVIPVALSVGETLGSTLREALDAVVLATDVSTRVVAASGMEGRGFDPVGTSTLLGAVTAAGRLMGLDEKKLLCAYGHSLNMMCGSFANMWAGAASFKFNQGWSSFCGIFAIRLAQIGWTSPPDPLQGPDGYFQLYTAKGCARPECLTDALGREFRDFVIQKPWPSCRFNHSAIQCALLLREKRPFSADEIEEIEIFLPAYQTKMFVCAPFKVRDFPQGDALFNIRFSAAFALLRGEVKPHDYTEDNIRSPQIRALADKTKITALPWGDRRAAVMRITLKDGAQTEVTLPVVKGDVPGNPMTEAEIEEKFWYNLHFCGNVEKERGEEILDLCYGGETAADLERLIALMMP